ncbi:MAG: RNA 2',3'-cyclic phosphodiesterase [Candidatus Micrarchaeota archaeon]
MRLFLAIDLPQETRRQLESVISSAKKLGLQASFTQTGQLHITLLFLGEKNEAEKDEIVRKLSALEFPKFRIAIKGTGFFPSARYAKVFWAGAQDEYSQISALYLRACEALGTRPERGFSGHVTLCRLKTPENLEALQQLDRAMQETQFGEFTAASIVLKKSALTPAGAVYEDLNTFPLK